MTVAATPIVFPSFFYELADGAASMIGCTDCDLSSMDEQNLTQLERLRTVLEVARRNGNQLFIDNIEREIAALERGDCSPIVEEYLTEEERS